jgi:hypothetical protein
LRIVGPILDAGRDLHLVERVAEADAAGLALGLGAGDAVDERTDLGIGA